MSSRGAPNPAELFEAHRPLMFGIAYRMLGSSADAEDIVQEAYLRFQRSNVDEIQSPRAFLGTIVTRLCLNQLQSARVQRETYIGPWLPEPILTGDHAVLAPSAPTPAGALDLHESISLAFLTLMEQLSPLERAVLLLREVFDYGYAEIAGIIGKDEAACRQLLSRAKKHLVTRRPRFKATPEQHRAILNQFMQVVGSGELDGLMQLLTDDVTMWADGGGVARGAATHALRGRRGVAQFILGSTRYLSADARVEIAEVNGELAAIMRSGASAVLVIALSLARAGIREIRVIGNPDKLGRV